MLYTVYSYYFKTLKNNFFIKKKLWINKKINNINVITSFYLIKLIYDLLYKDKLINYGENLLFLNTYPILKTNLNFDNQNYDFNSNHIKIYNFILNTTNYHNNLYF